MNINEYDIFIPVDNGDGSKTVYAVNKDGDIAYSFKDTSSAKDDIKFVLWFAGIVFAIILLLMN